MNRVFVSLYIIVVLSVVVIGWGTEKLWQFYTGGRDEPPYGTDLIALLEADLKKLDGPGKQAYVQKANRLTDSEIALYAVDELAESESQSALMRGDIVNVSDRDRGDFLFKRIGDSGWILSVTREPDRHGPGYLILLTIFYIGLGIAIYLWVWPLSRDLRKLERHTRALGRGTEAKIHLHPGSAVYHLALAFNRMSTRINELIRSHKEITYAVSHELRTPLARMKFALEIARNAKDRTEAADQIDSIEQDVGEMDHLVNQLLTYAGFEEQDRSLDLKPGDLESLAREVIDRLKQTGTPGPVIELESLLDGRQVHCDWPLIERALLNILQNARHHARHIIQVRLAVEKGIYTITVDDDGAGIPESERGRVFESFVRLTDPSARKTAGFGLGLSIVRRIMIWHNGESVAGQSPWGGARLILRWPAPDEGR